MTLDPITEKLGKLIDILEPFKHLGRQLSQTEELLIEVGSSVPALVVDFQTATILFATEEADELFGYLPGELAGHSVHMLVPPRFREEHREHFSRYAKQPKRRPMGQFGMTIVGLDNQNREFPIAVALLPRVLRDGRKVIIAPVLRITRDAPNE